MPPKLPMEAENRDKKAEPLPELPPVDPEQLQENIRRFLSKKKPEGGWKKQREKDGR